MDDDTADTEVGKLNNIQSTDSPVSPTVQDGSESHGVPETGLVFLRARWRLTILLLFTFMLLYMHRVNLSLAVVCMVKPDVQYNGNSNNSRSALTLQALNSSYSVSDIPGPSSGIDAVETDCSSLSPAEIQVLNPEMNWDYTQVSFLLSAYFYGSFFTQVPAGRLADYFGGKHIITMTHVLTIVCSLLVPISARTNFYLVLVLRVVIGLGGGAVIPVGIAMLTAWAPPRERAMMIGVSGSGFFIGTIISYLTSGFLCVYGFDNGWPSIFYSHSILSFILLCFWCFEAYSHPESHPRISKTELNFIQSTRQHVNQRSKNSVPWRHIFTSKAMWSTFIAHFAANWSFFTVLINVPLFLEEVLKYGVRQNGLYSALPYVFCAISTVASPKLAQMIINHSILGHLFTRRLFTCASLVTCAIVLVATGYVTCERREVGVVLLCIACFFMGLNFGGFLANHAEFSGQYSGTVYGITNAGGVISALLASMIAGLLTPNGLQEEWQLVFYISAMFNLVGALAFTTCSSVDLQPWAKPGSNVNCVIEIEIESPDIVEPLNSKEA